MSEQKTLIQRIRDDRIVAFKAKRNIEKDILGVLIAKACLKDKEPDQATVLSAIKSLIEGAEEVIKAVPKGDFNEYKANEEIKILSAYRPLQLTELAIRKAVEGLIAEGKNTIKAIMPELMQRYPNQIDGKLAKSIVEELTK